MRHQRNRVYVTICLLAELKIEHWSVALFSLFTNL